MYDARKNCKSISLGVITFGFALNAKCYNALCNQLVFFCEKMESQLKKFM